MSADAKKSADAKNPKSARSTEALLKAANDLKEVNVELEVEVTHRAVIETELAETKAVLEATQEALATTTASEEEARFRSLHDADTGLPNRELFLERLDHGLIQAKRHGWALAVLWVDLDKFKSVNDVHGHLVGDKVLQAVARRLEAAVAMYRVKRAASALTHG